MILILALHLACACPGAPMPLGNNKRLLASTQARELLPNSMASPDPSSLFLQWGWLRPALSQDTETLPCHTQSPLSCSRSGSPQHQLPVAGSSRLAPDPRPALSLLISVDLEA